MKSITLTIPRFVRDTPITFAEPRHNLERFVGEMLRASRQMSFYWSERDLTCTAHVDRDVRDGSISLILDGLDRIVQQGDELHLRVGNQKARASFYVLDGCAVVLHQILLRADDALCPFIRAEIPADVSSEKDISVRTESRERRRQAMLTAIDGMLRREVSLAAYKGLARVLIRDEVGLLIRGANEREVRVDLNDHRDASRIDDIVRFLYLIGDTFAIDGMSEYVGDFRLAMHEALGTAPERRFG